MLAGVLDKRAGGATTVASHHTCMGAWQRVGSLTIADPLPRLAGHQLQTRGAALYQGRCGMYGGSGREGARGRRRSSKSVGVAATASMRAERQICSK